MTVQSAVLEAGRLTLVADKTVVKRSLFGLSDIRSMALVAYYLSLAKWYAR